MGDDIARRVDSAYRLGGMKAAGEYVEALGAELAGLEDLERFRGDHLGFGWVDDLKRAGVYREQVPWPMVPVWANVFGDIISHAGDGIPAQHLADEPRVGSMGEKIDVAERDARMRLAEFALHAGLDPDFARVLTTVSRLGGWRAVRELLDTLEPEVVVP